MAAYLVDENLKSLPSGFNEVSRLAQFLQLVLLWTWRHYGAREVHSNLAEKHVEFREPSHDDGATRIAALVFWVLRGCGHFERGELQQQTQLLFIFCIIRIDQRYAVSVIRLDNTW